MRGRFSMIFTGLLCMLTTVGTAQTFTDLSEETGFNATGRNRGIAIGDFDNDGRDDIYVSRLQAPNLLYRNLGNFEFEEVGDRFNVASPRSTISSLWFDMDNDGDLDLFLVNSFQNNQLFRNDVGVFIDVSAAMGIETSGNTKTVHAADFDNDGDLDLYITATAEQNILWRNDGDNGFTNVTASSGIDDEGASLGAVWMDYDNDGWQDIYQTRDGAFPNLFWHNNGDGTFTEISAQIGLDFVGFGMGTDVADLNGDGRPDIYLTNLEENKLYLSNTDGVYREVSMRAGVDDIGMGWSVFFFDCDNDEDPDIYVANDSYFGVNGQSMIMNRLYVNQGDTSFTSDPNAGGVQNIFGTYGAAFSDLDSDGRLDLLTANTNDTDGNQMFQNTSEVGNYVGIKLRGRRSNSYGIGSKIQVFYGGQVQTDWVNAGSGYASQNTEVIHFGVGETQMIDSAVIHWPSGTRQVVRTLAVNTVNTIVEGVEIVSGAVVWTDPQFPSQDDEVTVYFNAKEGNGELAGFDGDIYAHTGVVTNLSPDDESWRHVVGNWGTADSRVLMTKEEEDIYSISYNINNFYNVPEGEEVSRLAFVFRNVDGSIVGRDTDGSDIYTPVVPSDGSLAIIVNSPELDIYETGDSVLVSATTNQEATLDVFDNGELIFTSPVGVAEFSYFPEGPGVHDLEFLAFTGDDTTSVVRTFYLAGTPDIKPSPEGIIDGLNYTDSSYIFQLHVPGKRLGYLLCDANGWFPDEDFALVRTPDEERLWVEVDRDIFPDSVSTYLFLIESALSPDPHSELVLDKNNDPFIDADIMEGLPAYPANVPFDYPNVSVFTKDPRPPFEWQYQDDFERPDQTNLVIYELLVRDFLDAHRFDAVMDTLDYLERLGVNAVQFMPVSEFEGNISWGYNPSFHSALDKYYGTPEQFKRLVDEVHRRGMAVIIDVVYNHTFSLGPLARLYWDASGFRPAPNSPYCNVVARHPFNVGYDINHESDATELWTKRSLQYWIEEYHVDGFRFDLSKGFTQKNTGNDVGAWGRYDASRIRILKDYADHIWSIDPESYVILEHFAENDEEIELSDYGMMLWGNETHQFAEAAMGYRSTLRGADYKQRGWNQPHLVAYMESHDEERMMYRLKNFGDGNSEYNTREEATALERVAAAAAIFYSIPGPKMLWQFGEVGYDFSINYCANGTISDACRTDPKPIRWDYKEDTNRDLLFRRMAAMIHLKTNYPTFSTNDYTFNDGNFFLKTVHLRHPEMDAVTLANYRIVASDVNPKFPYEGTWYEYITGDSIEVSNTEERLPFEPGEFRIYTSQRLTPPGGYITSITDPVAAIPLNISPNPVIAGTDAFVQWDGSDILKSLTVTSIDGRTVDVPVDVNDGYIRISTGGVLSAGMYVISITARDNLYTGKIVVLE